MFFDRLSEACAFRKTSPSAIALQVGRSKSNVTGWKKGQIPASDTATAIAEKLNIPIDFFLERPPFDCWSLINENRAGFLSHIDISADVLRVVWGINPEQPDDAPLDVFIHFLRATVINARPTEEGDWEIEIQPNYRKEKAPALTEKDRRDVARDVKRLMDDLESGVELNFDGVPMSEEAKAAMAAAVRIGFEEARRRNKETYTPKKYRKE